jgi:hypothetical protein
VRIETDDPLGERIAVLAESFCLCYYVLVDEVRPSEKFVDLTIGANDAALEGQRDNRHAFMELKLCIVNKVTTSLNELIF